MKLSRLVAITVFACLSTSTLGQFENGTCSQIEQQGNFRGDPTQTDCSAHYFCESDRWLLYRCAIGLVFNNETQLCVFPKDNPSCNKPTPDNPLSRLTPISQATECVFPCGSTDVVYPKVSNTAIDCQRYYVCQGGQLYEGSCVDVGVGFQYFNTFSRSCSRRVDSWNFNCPLSAKKKRRRRRR